MNRLRSDAKLIAAVLAFTLLSFELATASVSTIVVSLAGAIAMVAITVQPAWGLVILALAIPFGRLVSLPMSSVGAVDALVALTLTAWVARGLASRNLSLKRTPLLWPLAIFLWVGALSLISARSWQQGALEWLKWAEFAVLYLLATQVLERRYVILVLIAFFGAATLEVALGAYQFARNVGPEAFALSEQYTRAYGTLQQPNPYAAYLGYIVPVALSLALWALTRWWSSSKASWFFLGLLSLGLTIGLLVGIGLSWSRGAWLGAVVSIVVIIAFRSRRAMIVTGSILLVLFAVILLLGSVRLPQPIAGRVAALGDYVVGPDPAIVEVTDQNFSVLERLAHWQAGIRMFNSAPWLGIGLGNYADAYPDFVLPPWYEPLGHAHNLYVNFLGETGLLGAAGFLLLWASMMVLSARGASTGDGLLRALALGLLGTLAYLTVHNLFDNVFVQHLQLQLALLLGAVVALRSHSAYLAS